MKKLCVKTISTCLLALTFAALGCSSGSDVAGGGPLVTVSGIVLSIDDGACAEGTVVFLLDFEDKYVTSAATGSDCAFSLQVPSGSKFLLATDDFDASKRGITGDWFPLVNYDVINTPTIEKDLSNVVIHACPQSKGKVKGSIAAWENYLANGDSGNGDLFVPTTTDDASILAMVFLGVDSGAFSFTQNMSVTADETDFPIAYARLENIFDENGVPDSSLGPNAYYPSTQTKTDGSGFVTGFVSSTSREITVNISDADTTRKLAFNTPLKVPIREHMITLILPGEVDGKANQPPCHVFFEAGFVPADCSL